MDSASLEGNRSPARAKVLVLGAGGMLGHKLVQKLAPRYDIVGTLRSSVRSRSLDRIVGSVPILTGVDASQWHATRQVIEQTKPAIVLNCIGIIKQLEEAKSALQSIEINALLPHRLARLAKQSGFRLIHFSTDCVFSGLEGNYTEDDIPDPQDLYGRTKHLGEVSETGCLTIRSSIVGHELTRHVGLIDWFISQAKVGQVNGFARALYSGLSTSAMADVVERCIQEWPGMEGVWHVSSDPISKYDLLRIVSEVYGLGMRIARDEGFVCDRRLDSGRFRAHTGWRPPAWPDMIRDMHRDYVQPARACP